MVRSGFAPSSLCPFASNALNVCSTVNSPDGVILKIVPLPFCATELGHAIKDIVGTARQCNARSGSVLVVSVRIQRAEGMQHRILMRLPDRTGR